MSSLGRKKVTVQYRKLDDLTGAFGSKSLQQTISASLKLNNTSGAPIGESAAVRQYVQDINYGTVVLNNFTDGDKFFFGELVRFEPGANLPLIQTASGTATKTYALTQAKAPDGHEPIRGVLYFMAINNHVVFLENDVSAARAETYLTWLLCEATSALPKGTHVILLAELAAQADAKTLSHVEQIIFKPQPIGVEDSVREALIHDAVIGSQTRDVEHTNTFDVLRAAGMGEADIQRLVDGDTRLEVTLQIKFKGDRKKRLLGIEDAARLLRNVPEDELTLIGPGGRQKEGRIVKLSYVANVALIGTLLDFADVARALHEGYKYFVSNGYIDG